MPLFLQKDASLLTLGKMYISVFLILTLTVLLLFSSNPILCHQFLKVYFLKTQRSFLFGFPSRFHQKFQILNLKFFVKRRNIHLQEFFEMRSTPEMFEWYFLSQFILRKSFVKFGGKGLPMSFRIQRILL